MRGSEVLVAGALLSLSACSGSTVASIGTSGGKKVEDAGLLSVEAGRTFDARSMRDAPADRVSMPLVEASAESCVAVVSQPELLAVDMYLVLEYSSATAEAIPGTTTTWWAATLEGLRSFSEHMYASGNSMALQYFPRRDSDGSDCAGDYVTPDLELAPLSPQTVTTVESHFVARAPGSGRPTGPALEGTVAHLQTRPFDQTVGRTEAIVLVTRGDPDMCSPGTLVELKSYVAAFDGAPIPARVYSIGLGQSAEAMAGLGEGDPEFFFIRGGDVAARVRDALLRVLLPPPSLTACNLNLPVPQDGKNLDLSRITVTIDSYIAGHEDVPRLASAADCDRNASKGFYLDVQDGAWVIQLCARSCSDLPGKFGAEFYCLP